MIQDTIKMQTVSEALYVDVSMWNSVSQKFNTALLTFDTGATVTTISSEILRRLGYDVDNGKKEKITTGSGVAYVREIIVDRVRIGKLELENVRVYAHEFPDECFTVGVIGLNVLSQFDILLSFSNKTIKLAKIEQ